MTPRDRQLAAIRHEMADRVSTDAICIENVPQILEHLRMDELEVNERTEEVRDGGFAHLRYLRQNLDPLFDRLGLDGRIIQAVYTGEIPLDDSGRPMSEWRTATGDDYGTAHGYPLGRATDIAEVERFPWPSAADYDYDSAASYAAKWAAKYAMRGPYWKPLFCQVCELVGMEETMIRMVASPAVFEAILEGVFCHVLEYCERFLDACGESLPIFYLGDDFATQRGLMISPALWRRFLKPRLAKLFRLGKRRGKYVWFHSCGDVTSVLPDLIEIGMDVWETVQLHTLPISAERLKREYGKEITFFGGVNTQRLPFATPDEVAREVRRCIETLGKDGGYICGPDHHVKPDVPAVNLLALYDTATSIGRDRERSAEPDGRGRQLSVEGGIESRQRGSSG